MAQRKKSHASKTLQSGTTILLSEVPGYLRDGELYQTFSENGTGDDGETITIPHCYFKPDASVGSHKALNKLLETVRYWMIHTLPEEVYSFLLNAKQNKYIDEVVNKFAEQYPILITMRRLSLRSPAGWLAEAARLGDEEMMAYLRKIGHNWSGECAYAAEHGQLQALQYAHEHGCPWRVFATGCACQNAIRGGHFECLKYAHEHGCPRSRVRAAAFRAHRSAECFEYALANGIAQPDSLYRRDYSLMAIKLRTVRGLQWMATAGWPLHWDAYSVALETRHIDTILQVIRTGCWLDPQAATNLLFSQNSLGSVGQRRVLLALSDRNLIIEPSSLRTLSVKRRKQLLAAMIQHNACAMVTDAAIAIAATGETDLVRMALERGMERSPEYCTSALKQKNYPMLLCALEFDCPIPANAVGQAWELAGQYGNRDMMDRLRPKWKHVWTWV